MAKRIAIVGTGISGLTSAYLLNRQHDITVFEANDYIGGHTATKDVSVNGEQFAIDTGFIVFNDWTYPNFIKLLTQLGVAYQETEMSFSVHHEKTNIEYNGHDLNTLFAQRRNLLRPRFWRIVNDIVKFNKTCKTVLENNEPVEGITLADFIARHGFSDSFSEHYIYPMCAAIWSASLEQTKAFPLAFFLKFFNNHGLLNITDRPQWYTIMGGSREYIKPLTASFAERIKLNTPVQSVRTVDKGIEVITAQGDSHLFDEIIFACHSDQALQMMAEPSADHKAVLGAIPYAENDVVLHTDTAQLPQRKLAWASWNYRLTGSAEEQARPAAVTYNMNILQRLVTPTTFCVSLNSPSVNQNDVLGEYRYAHPQFSENMVAAQNKRHDICGVDHMHFCGAYWYNGFHEDGVRSALDVCKRFGEEL